MQFSWKQPRTAQSHSVCNICWDFFVSSQISLLLSGLITLLISQMLLMDFSCSSRWGKGKRKKQWRSWVVGRHSPTVSDHYHSLWITFLWICRSVLEKRRQHLTNQHDIVQADWKLGINDPHGSTSRFSEQVLNTKTGFGKAGFALEFKGLKTKNNPPPQKKRKALLIKAQLEMTGLHWQAATPRKSWTDFSTITHRSKHCENTVWPGRS